MATISTTINTVSVKFNSAVVNDVTEKMTKGLEACIKKDVAKDCSLIDIIRNKKLSTKRHEDFTKDSNKVAIF